MMKQKIRDFLTASPFVPFSIEMASGKSYDVFHPDFVVSAADSADIVIEDSDGVWQVLNPMLITAIASKPGSEINGSSA